MGYYSSSSFRMGYSSSARRQPPGTVGETLLAQLNDDLPMCHQLKGVAKSGTTWLAALLGALWIDNCLHLSSSSSSPSSSMCQAAALNNTGSLTRLTPLGCGHPYGEKHRAVLDTNHKEHYNTIFIFRDTRDVLMSSFHYFNHTGSGSDIHSFVRGEQGVLKTIKGQNNFVTLFRAYRSSQYGERAMLVFYEDLHLNSTREATRLGDFLGFKSLSADGVAIALEKTSFRAMQQSEADGAFAKGDRENRKERYASRLREASNDPDKVFGDEIKVRKGKVGGFADELQGTDLAFVETSMKTLLDPWLLRKFTEKTRMVGFHAGAEMKRESEGESKREWRWR